MKSDSGPANLGPLARLRFLLRDSLLYGGATVVSRLTTLVTFPIFLRNLTVADYGLLDYFQMLGAFVVIFLVFGQESAVSRYFFEFENTEDRQRLISQSLFFRLALATLFIPIVWYLAPRVFFHGWSEGDPVYLFRIALCHVPFVILLNFSISILRITFSRYLYVALTVGWSFFQASLWLIALLVLDLGVAGIMYASVLSAAVFGCLGLYLVRSWLIIPTDLRVVWQILPYAIPYGAVTCLDAANPILERSLVKMLLDTDALGLYAAGAKVAFLFAILAYAFQTAWNPFALAIHKSPDAGRTYDQVFRLWALTVCLAALAIGAVSGPVVVLLGSERFAAATPVVFPLVLSLAIIALSWIVEVGINLSKRTQFKLLSYLLSTIAAFGMIYYLTPRFGILGAPFGVLAGSIVRLASTTYFSQRLYPLPWSIGPVALLIGATAVFGLAGTLLAPVNGPGLMMALCGAGGVFVGALALFHLFSRDEWRKASEVARAYWQALQIRS